MVGVESAVVVIALVDGAGVEFVLQSVVTVAPSFGDDYKHFDKNRISQSSPAPREHGIG